MQTSSYRRDIDGLRAIAVLSVVLYHVGFSWLPGGFVGVDVFFVISGYLIIGQIIATLRSGKFSFEDFWARRALRILPPYLLVIVTSMAIAPFVLVLPGEYAQFTQEVLWSAFMGVNHLFLSQQGYFDGGADQKVLLHLWSLAVEEQFYLFAPLLIVGFWRFVPKSLWLGATALLFIVSLAACVVWTGNEGDTNYAFYLMPLRAWEFVAGGAIGLFVPVLLRMPRIRAEILSWVGLAAIVGSVALFSHDTPFPSFWAAIPVFGASAIILAGSRQTIVGAGLSTAPMRFVGLVSYSWYLWHWPLLAFARIYNFGDRSFYVDLSMAGLSFLLAVATRYAVEVPVLKWRRNGSLPLKWRSTGIGAAACSITALAAVFVFTDGGKGVFASASASAIADADLCNASIAIPADCLASGKPTGLLVGDSHAGSAVKVMSQYASLNGSTLVTATSAGCLSLLTAEILSPQKSWQDRCKTGHGNVLQMLRDKTITPEYAILYSRWPLYSTGKRYMIGLDGTPVKNQQAAFISEMRNTIATLKKNGVARIMVLLAPPVFPRDVPSCVARADHYGISRDKCSAPFDKQEYRRRIALKWISAATDGLEGVEVVDPFPVFCDAKTCRPYSKDKVLFRDENHPSNAGVEALIEANKRRFSWLFGATE